MVQPAKFDQARRIAAALCYIGLAHLDRVTILPFAGTIGDETVPGRGKGRIFRVFELLEAMRVTGDTNLREAFKQFASRGRQQGLAVVISDFLDPHGFESGLKVLRSMGHDVFAVHVSSQHDRDPGALGEARFVDAETNELRDIEVTPALADAYARAWQAHADELERFCGRYDIGYVRAEAEMPFEDIILQTFRKGRFLA